MVATSAFGLGIDKRDIRFVMHFQSPASLEQYVQEAGRGGRDGRKANCILLYDGSDRAIHEALLARSRVRPDQLYKLGAALAAWAEEGREPTVQALAVSAELGPRIAGALLTKLEEAGLVRWEDDQIQIAGAPETLEQDARALAGQFETLRRRTRAASTRSATTPPRTNAARSTCAATSGNPTRRRASCATSAVAVRNVPRPSSNRWCGRSRRSAGAGPGVAVGREREGGQRDRGARPAPGSSLPALAESASGVGCYECPHRHGGGGERRAAPPPPSRTPRRPSPQRPPRWECRSAASGAARRLSAAAGRVAAPGSAPRALSSGGRSGGPAAGAPRVRTRRPLRCSALPTSSPVRVATSSAPRA